MSSMMRLMSSLRIGYCAMQKCKTITLQKLCFSSTSCLYEKSSSESSPKFQLKDLDTSSKQSNENMFLFNTPKSSMVKIMLKHDFSSDEIQKFMEIDDFCRIFIPIFIKEDEDTKDISNIEKMMYVTKPLMDIGELIKSKKIPSN